MNKAIRIQWLSFITQNTIILALIYLWLIKGMGGAGKAVIVIEWVIGTICLIGSFAITHEKIEKNYQGKTLVTFWLSFAITIAESIIFAWNDNIALSVVMFVGILVYTSKLIKG